MRTILLALGAAVLLAGCAGSGPNGEWTAGDTNSALGALNQGINTYRNAQAAYSGQPYYPAAP